MQNQEKKKNHLTLLVFQPVKTALKNVYIVYHGKQFQITFYPLLVFYVKFEYSLFFTQRHDSYVKKNAHRRILECLGIIKVRPRLRRNAVDPFFVQLIPVARKVIALLHLPSGDFFVLPLSTLQPAESTSCARRHPIVSQDLSQKG